MMSATGEKEASTLLQEGKLDQTTGRPSGRKNGCHEFYEFPIMYLYDASTGSYVTGRRFAQRKNEPRYLQDLKVSATDPEDAIAAELCEKLFEAKTALILSIVEVLGGEKAIQLFKETQKLEIAGGILVKSCSRRRTSGGIYLYLFTHDPTIPREQIKRILKEDRENYLRKITALREKTRQRIEELLQKDLKKSELTRAEKVIQSEQGTSSPSPEPETDASDCSCDTDSDDGHEDNPMGCADAPVGYSGGHIGGASATTPPLEKHCAKCTMERNRRAQVAFIKRLFYESF